MCVYMKLREYMDGIAFSTVSDPLDKCLLFLIIKHLFDFVLLMQGKIKVGAARSRDLYQYLDYFISLLRSLKSIYKEQVFGS